MTNKEMLEAIEQIQPYINNVIAGKLNRWKDPDKEVALVEKLYNIITGRRYIKFCNTCPSVIREALIIINNWKKRELKKAEHVAKIPTPEPIPEPKQDILINVKIEPTEKVDESKPVAKVTKPKAPTKPKANGTRRK